MADEGRDGAGAELQVNGSSTTETGQAAGVARLHERLVTAGALLAATHGRRSVARFVDVRKEHARLCGAAGLLDQTDRGTVRLFGRRARGMLDGLLTNDLEPLDRGTAVYGFLLNAKGRPIAEARVLPRSGEGELWLDVPAACLEGLLDHLGRTLPPLYARFEVRSEVARLGLVGPGAADALAAWPDGPGKSAAELPALGVVAPDGEVDGAADGAADGTADGGREASHWTLVVRREPEEGPGFDVYVPADRLVEAWEGLARAAAGVGGGPAGREAYEIWRIERGVPVYGADIGPENLPQETGQENRAISFSKGCYTGQEVVARIHYRGHVNRHLRGLQPEPLPPPGRGREDEGAGAASEPVGMGGLRAGAKLHREGRAVATVTSAARSPRLGPIALGYVRREIEPGELLSADPEAAPSVRVVQLPFTST